MIHIKKIVFGYEVSSPVETMTVETFGDLVGYLVDNKERLIE